MIVQVGLNILTTEPIRFRREVEVVVTPQAQRVLNTTKHSLEEFVDWSLERQGFSLGGHNVVVFLEAHSDE